MSAARSPRKHMRNRPLPNRLVDALAPWTDNQEFCRDAAKFLSLSGDAITALVALIENHATFGVPASEVAQFETNYELVGSGRGILAAAQLIRSVVRRYDDYDCEQDLIEFANSVGVGSVAPGFSRFFSRLPRLDTEVITGRAIQVAPTVVNVNGYCDLRVVSDPPNVKWGLVPVVVMRLEFDESVAGQQALFVQLTEESIGKLKREVEKVGDTLTSARRRYATDLLAQKGGET